MNPPIVYLDTGPLKGLLDVRDQAHERATRYFRRSTEERARIRAPYPVLLELHRLLIYRKPPRSDASRLAVVALERIRETYPVVHPEGEHIDRALKLLARFDDQKITLTDATVASMATAGGAQVMTFDQRHFNLMGASMFGADV